jgi:small-conductance mechanosensitive channel/CRP-like cAMP-binding protein
MRYAETRLLILPVLLFLFFFGIEYHGTRWHALLTDEMHYALQTLTWLSGGWLFMRTIQAFVWQRRQKHLSGAAPMLLQHTVNILILLLATAGIAHSVFNQPLTGFWATSGVFGIVLGIALRGIIADFFSGIALELDPPFRIGDYVELRMGGDPVIGRVTEVNWRATQIVPRDDTNTLFVPNSLMASIAVNNVYKPLGNTRFELFISFHQGISHDRIVRVLMSAIRTTRGITQELVTEVVATKFNTAGVDYIVRYWLPPDVSPTGARDRLMAAILELARRDDLYVAFPREEIVYEPKPAAVADPLEKKIGFLQRNSFFGSCRPEELKTIATHMHTRQYPPGTPIVKIGDPGDSMFLVSEGLLEASLPNGSENHPLVVGKLLAGDFFGEMSLLADEPRSATVTSVTGTVLYQIRRPHIQDLVRSRPEIADSMTDVAAHRRLQNQNADLALDSDTPSEEHRNLKSMIMVKIHSLCALLSRDPPFKGLSFFES